MAAICGESTKVVTKICKLRLTDHKTTGSSGWFVPFQRFEKILPRYVMVAKTDNRGRGLLFFTLHFTEMCWPHFWRADNASPELDRLAANPHSWRASGWSASRGKRASKGFEVGEAHPTRIFESRHVRLTCRKTKRAGDAAGRSSRLVPGFLSSQRQYGTRCDRRPLATDRPQDARSAPSSASNDVRAKRRLLAVSPRHSRCCSQKNV